MILHDHLFTVIHLNLSIETDLVASSVDPHQTPHYPTSDQQLHCLSLSPHFFRLIKSVKQTCLSKQCRTRSDVAAATLIWLSGRAGWSEFFLGWLYIFALKAHIIWHDFCFSWLSTQLGVFLHSRPDICYEIISLICEILSFVTIKVWTWERVQCTLEKTTCPLFGNTGTVAQLVERPLCDREVCGFDPRPSLTKDDKNGSSCSFAWRSALRK